jgi:hypothetical protein
MEGIDSIEEIAKVFIDKNINKIRYFDITFIPGNYKALFEMESLSLVIITFEENKIFIEKNF